MKAVSSQTSKGVTCGWCLKGFNIPTDRGEYGWGQQRCPHCARFVRSSRKEAVEEFSSRKHVHFDLRNGDVV